MKFANEKLNSMTPGEIRELQEFKLRRQIAYCFENSEFYRRKFKEAGAHPADIKTLDDLRKLPIMMTKQDERESQEESLESFGHPFGMHLCGRRKISNSPQPPPVQRGYRLLPTLSPAGISTVQ